MSLGFMNIDSQARILGAFLRRMDNHDLEIVADIVAQADQAGEQLSTSSQVVAHQRLDFFLNACLLRINRTDRGSMVAIINQEMEKTKDLSQ
jgi:hypothetical protein